MYVYIYIYIPQDASGAWRSQLEVMIEQKAPASQYGISNALLHNTHTGILHIAYMTDDGIDISDSNEGPQNWARVRSSAHVMCKMFCSYSDFHAKVPCGICPWCSHSFTFMRDSVSRRK